MLHFCQLFTTEIIEVWKWQEIKKKPKAVVEYSDTMGGIDRVDQNLTNYPISKKGGKKYYKKYSFI